MVPTGSHAYLTLGLHWVEPREHVVPIAVSHNNQIWHIQVRGEAGLGCGQGQGHAVSEGATGTKGEGLGNVSAGSCGPHIPVHTCTCVAGHAEPSARRHMHKGACIPPPHP